MQTRFLRAVACATTLATWCFFGAPVFAQAPPGNATATVTLGPVMDQAADTASLEIDQIHSSVVATARSLGLPGPNNFEGPAYDRSTGITYEWPLRVKASAKGSATAYISNFVDLNTTTVIGDHACGTRSYDGHRGIDIGIGIFSWWRQDTSEMEIIAAAPGVITQKQEGQLDRTCGNLSTVPSNPANYVIIAHSDGSYGYYWHMKNGTVTAKGVGESVAKGEKLGIVGSSGRSTGPHLHFELRGDDGSTIDPFAGTCGAARSLWRHQWRAHNDFRMSQIATSTQAHTFASTCTNNYQVDTDVPNFKDVFTAGEPVRGIFFLRDQFPGDTVRMQAFDPSGALYTDLTSGTAPSGSFYRTSWWWLQFTPPTSGQWRLRGTTSNGTVMEHTFFVGVAAPAATTVFSSILPGGRSVQVGQPATVFATMLNATANVARGCTIHPETPIHSDFWFQTTDPATNQLNGERNKSVDIPANDYQTFVISFTPRADARKAEAIIASMRMKCANSDVAPVLAGVNTMLFSFDTTPVPDVIPIAATVTNNGVVHVPGNTGSAFWAAASVNIGLNATLTVSPELSTTMPLTVTVCRTNPATGACLAPAAASVAVPFTPNETRTFAIFVTASGAVPFDPATRRISLNFKDAAGVVRGQTGVAVRTN